MGWREQCEGDEKSRVQASRDRPDESGLEWTYPRTIPRFKIMISKVFPRNMDSHVIDKHVPRGINSGGHFLIMRRRWEMVWAGEI